ncbi:hypothetical protein ACFPRL_24335 [Pseudoclavibacter helvolus]
MGESPCREGGSLLCSDLTDQASPPSSPGLSHANRTSAERISACGRTPGGTCSIAFQAAASRCASADSSAELCRPGGTERAAARLSSTGSRTSTSSWAPQTRASAAASCAARAPVSCLPSIGSPCWMRRAACWAAALTSTRRSSSSVSAAGISPSRAELSWRRWST